MAFILFTDVIGVLAGLTLLAVGGLGWTGRRRVLAGWPARSRPNRRAGRAWTAVGIGALVTVAGDLIAAESASVMISWAGIALMTTALIAGILASRHQDSSPFR